MPSVVEQKSFDYANEIWKIADYVRDVIKRKDYNRVILPFALLRRLECALEDTRDAVCEAVEKHEAEWGREHDNYCQSSGKAFYNVTSFRLNNLGATNTLEALMDYINGFSPNAREILLKFKMEETCKTLADNNMLYEVCRRFSAFDLSPENVSDREMSNIYEHLIEKFGEEIAEDAEDFMTPKDVVRLAVGMIFANDEELMNADEGIVRTLYDPTAGTCGFITDALDQLDEWHKEKKMVAPALIVPYGQEIEDESWAMGKANLLLRNVSNDDRDIYDQIKDLSAHIMQGDTLAEDKFPYDTFDYLLSNPPYGKKWEKSQEAVLDEAKLGFRGRFGAGLPSIDDGSMLFLQHVVAKMKPAAEGGAKAGIVLSASPLFTGDAGQGPSNIRRWLFQQDVIDCIVKLPAEIFFRTGINTYLWILNNNKPEERRDKVQLIDASGLRIALRKPLGNKHYEISEEQRGWIIRTYIDGHDHGKSLMVPVEDFMYRQVVTQQPLHAVLDLNDDKIREVANHPALAKLSANNMLWLQEALSEYSCIESPHGSLLPYEKVDEIVKYARKDMTKPEATPANMKKAILDTFVVKGEQYPVVHDNKGNVVYDPDLKDKENIPWTMTFDEYMKTEVLPYAPETVIDETVVDKGPLQDGNVGVVGASISFNKYFYKYVKPRDPQEIASEILELQNGLESFMEGFLK